VHCHACVTVTAASLLGINLLLDLQELAGLLAANLDDGGTLDAFLLAAGMNQIIEDYLHRDFLQLRRTAPHLAGLAFPVGQAAAAVLTAAAGLGDALRRAGPGERQVLPFQRRLSVLVQLLAIDVVRTSAVSSDLTRRDEQGPREERTAEVRRLAAEALAGLAQLPHDLLRQVVSQPTSFRSLDQQPADLQTIVEKFSRDHADRGARLLLVGIRTSGSYLAPLYRAYLEAAGYREVRVMTIRPEHDLLPGEVQEVREVVKARGLLLVADDPPKTGAAMATCLRRFERIGVSPDSIVLLLPLLEETDSPPPRLAGYRAVTLPRSQWAIQERLTPAHLVAELDELLRGRTIQLSTEGRKEWATVEAVLSERPVQLPQVAGFQVGSASRRHSRALVRVRLLEAGTGREFDHDVYVKGVGLGYFGDHSAVTAGALAEFLPELYGVRHGLLFRRWLPESYRLEQPGSPEDLDQLGDRIGDYVHARSSRLAVAEDTALRSGGAQEEVVKLLARSFGRLALPSRVLLRPVTRRLLRVAQASVVDGSMSPRQWFRMPAHNSDPAVLLKVDYDERAFSNQDTVVDELYSFDPVFDLAGAAASFAIDSNDPVLELRFETSIRAAFEVRGGVAVPAERWLLYQLLHATSHTDFLQEALDVKDGWHSTRPAPPSGPDPAEVARYSDAARKAMARFEQRYLSALFLADMSRKADGPLCAIDVDGVLEVASMGYSSCTPLGALCLRAMISHGYRPLLATGRSLDEVRDRCLAYGLRGGVAEYGAVLYDAIQDRVIELLSEEQRRTLDLLRSELDEIPGVHVDAAHKRSVRASGGNAAGRRRPLAQSTVMDVLGRLGLVDEVWVVHGDAQTDLLLKGVDKGRGVQALLRSPADGRAAAESRPLALAVGDTELDLPVLRLARMALAPANADRKVREAGVEVTSGECQQGLARAVARLLGHYPGTCPVCRARAPSRDAKLLLAVLSAQSAARWGKLLAAARLFSLLRS
jgi:hydroxymethylpyrimidine pyrophosphatase-like HAD family hydrolase